MTSQSIINEIDTKIAGRSLLSHPFYKAWTEGGLSLDALQDYSRQYYHHVAAFPTYLSAVHSHTEDQAVRMLILSNLMDEEAGDPNHPEMWLQFAESLGVDEDDVRSTELYDETVNLVGTFRGICRDRSTVAGLAALYAYESQIPEVSETKIAGLQQFYGIDSTDGQRYFKVHIEADKEHSAVERELLLSYIEEDDREEVVQAVDETLEALWDMLSGICRRHNIAC